MSPGAAVSPAPGPGDRRQRAGQPVILIGYSRAGPLLATAGAMLGERVRGYIFVDARLPAPGRSWMETVTPGLAARLREMAGRAGPAAAVAAMVGQGGTGRASARSGCPAAFRCWVSPAAAGHVGGSSSACARVTARSRWLSPAQRGLRRRGGPDARTRLAGEADAEPPPRARDRTLAAAAEGRFPGGPVPADRQVSAAGCYSTDALVDARRLSSCVNS